MSAKSVFPALLYTMKIRRREYAKSLTAFIVLAVR